MHGVLQMLIFFGFIAAVVIVPQVIKSRDRQRMFDTMRTAYERGQPVPPELVDAIVRPRAREADIIDALNRSGGSRDMLDYLPESQRSRDLRRGVVWVAVGAGLFLIGVAFYAGLYNDGGAAETLASFSAIGAIPFCIGLAFLGLWRFSKPAAVSPGYAPPASAATPPTYAPPPSIVDEPTPPHSQL